MSDLINDLKQAAEGDLLPWGAQMELARRHGVSVATVEEAALQSALLPARYQRNRNTLSTADQLKLFRSVVGIVGCGGLGGYVVEELARLGVGTLITIDPDVFEEHNLNRQVLATIELLGKPKAEVAATRVAAINPAVTVKTHVARFSKENGAALFHGVHVAVDALDSIATRLELASVCAQLSIPLVHGSIAGMYGQLITQLPGETTLERIYGRCRETTGVEKELGNPSFTPAIVASLQVAEAAKLLLGKGKPLSGAMLFINLLEMDIQKVTLC